MNQQWFGIVCFSFGSGQPGKRTGILFNTGANDFSISRFQNQFGLSASPANSLQPKKRPLTSMSPIIVTDKNNDVQLVLGASGGTKIITAVSLVKTRNSYLQPSVLNSLFFPDNYRYIMVPAECQRGHRYSPNSSSTWTNAGRIRIRSPTGNIRNIHSTVLVY